MRREGASLARRHWLWKLYIRLAMVIGPLAGLSGLATMGWEFYWGATHGTSLSFLAFDAFCAVVEVGCFAFLVWFLVWWRFWRPLA